MLIFPLSTLVILKMWAGKARQHCEGARKKGMALVESIGPAGGRLAITVGRRNSRRVAQSLWAMPESGAQMLREREGMGSQRPMAWLPRAGGRIIRSSRDLFWDEPRIKEQSSEAALHGAVSARVCLNALL